MSKRTFTTGVGISEGELIARGYYDEAPRKKRKPALRKRRKGRGAWRK